MGDIVHDNMKDKILAIEREMIKAEPIQVQLEPVHHFADGLYARELLIPAGVLLTGKIHKHEHLNIISKGDITVWTEEGMKRIQAPFTVVSQPGMKRLGFAHSDTVWTTIHAVEGRDMAELERLLVCDTFEEFQAFLGNEPVKQIGE